jgi:TldD protein
MDNAAVSRWIEAAGARAGDLAEVFVEERRETFLEWRDGGIVASRVGSSGGLSARLKRGSVERLAFVSRTDEEGAREAIRALAELGGGEDFSPLPRGGSAKDGRSRPSPHREPVATGGQTSRSEPSEGPDAKATLSAAESSSPDVERWIKRLGALLSRHAPRHRMRWTLAEVSRHVIPAGAPASSFTRRLISLEGELTAASRRGDEARRFAFHAPDFAGAADELRSELSRAAAPRDAPLPCGAGETDVVFANGSAAVFFHEVLSHPLEEGGSPLTLLKDAHLAAADLTVRDDPMRLDLFGGYERDDEGTRPRAVKLLDAGRLAGGLTDRARARAGQSTGHARRAEASDVPLVRGSNTVVEAGGVSADEMTRRLSDGLWIEELAGGSVEIASGRFRMWFPRARRVRRGGIAEETGPGVVVGDLVSALRNVEAGIGREARPCRALGWCARAGQVVPVQGEAPDVLVRRLSVRSSL